VDRNQIIHALEEAQGRIGGASGAAARLGLKRTTFITRMNKLGINPNPVSQLKMDSTDTSGTSDISVVQDPPSDLSS
jgi:Bacterial regulatory protein, Fis family